MMWVLLWLLCALIAAYLYAGKGRPWAWGVLAGLLLGPVGVLLAALTRKQGE